MPELFFIASRDFFKEHTSVCNLAHAVASALWNMRYQVKGYYAEAGFYETGSKPNQADLRARFLAGSGLQKTDFYGMVAGPHWEDVLALHARTNLLSTISLFEGWVDALKQEYALSGSQADALQWPSSSVYPRHAGNGSLKPGVGEALAGALSAGVSSVMANSVAPTVRASRNFKRLELDALLVCYRAWKEVRNSVVHSGGRASQRAVSDVVLLSSFTPANLGMSWVPSPTVGGVGSPVLLSFRDVMSFGEVLQKIVTTIDGELASTDVAEQQMWERWESHRRRSYADASSNDVKRWNRIKLDFRAAQLPTPADPKALDVTMRGRYGALLRPPPAA